MKLPKPVENANEGKEILYKRVIRLMGNRFEFTIVASEKASEFAENAIDQAVAEVQRIEKLLTTYDDHSQTNQINRAAGIEAVQVDREVFDLIARSQRISALTQGAFDISYGSIDKRLWNFDKTMASLPDAETAKQMVRLINYKNILLDDDNGTVMLREKGMRIGFGGIGKGYAAEMAKRQLQELGIKNGIVNAAGDLVTWGLQADGKPWTIGIAHPDAADKPFSMLEISNAAVATSGNYEKYVIIDGVKYSHTINPKSGLPITGIKSVTIITTNAEIADAMATPVMIMGIEVGLNLINQMQQIACIIIDDQDNLFTSRNIKLT